MHKTGHCKLQEQELLLESATYSRLVAWIFVPFASAL